MSYKHLLSLGLLTFVLQSCGDTPDEKKLKQRNDELSRQNQELTQSNEQTAAERDAALKNKEATASELAKAQKDLETAKQALKKTQDEKAAVEKTKIKLEADLAKQEKSVKDLNKQIEAKNTVIAEKEAQITSLNSQLGGNSSELKAAQKELTELKQERDALKADAERAEASAKTAREQLKAVQDKILELQSHQTAIIGKSLEDVHGLWLNEVQVERVTDATCYEFVHVGTTGNFAQAIACSDGRVQIQKHFFDRFSAQAVPEKRDSDYLGSYGFALDGIAASNDCNDPTSLLTAGPRLVFEMTSQDLGDSGGSPASRNMLVVNREVLKDFKIASDYFGENITDYSTISGLATDPRADVLTKAAAAFLGNLEGQADKSTVGCFNAGGIFSTPFSN
jgi:uncharacterized coiled-coil protein SlyX